MRRTPIVLLGSMFTLVAVYACAHLSTKGTPENEAVRSQPNSFTDDIEGNASGSLKEGRSVFRLETFGDEYFWSDTLQLHLAIAGQRHGGVGPGLTPRQALAVGLKVDVDHLPSIMANAIRGGSASLDEVQTTLELVKADAVVGVQGFYGCGGLVPTGIGIT